jgi:hypothetical protein
MEKSQNKITILFNKCISGRQMAKKPKNVSNKFKLDLTWAQIFW